MSAISLMYKRNRVGPNTLPWGTPLVSSYFNFFETDNTHFNCLCSIALYAFNHAVEDVTTCTIT